MTRLVHYSSEPLLFDPHRIYNVSNPRMDGMKPGGFWLSDDSDYGWREWCENQEFNISSLAYKTLFKVKTNSIIILDTDQKIFSFSQEYTIKKYGLNLNGMFINWEKVSEKYSGILITPYSWHLRTAPGLMWFYGWDCASACIWDLSTLELI